MTTPPRAPAPRSPVRVLALGAALHLEACGARAVDRPPGPPAPNEGAGEGVGEGLLPSPAPPTAAPPEAPPTIAEAQAGPPGRPTPTGPLLTRNPPPPPPPPAPGAPLPRWDEVASTHPAGATNPPAPVLVVQRDGARCWKAWRGGMLRPSAEEQALGGRVVEVGALVDGTEIQCPAERAQAVLAAHARGPAR